MLDWQVSDAEETTQAAVKALGFLALATLVLCVWFVATQVP